LDKKNFFVQKILQSSADAKLMPGKKRRRFHIFAKKNRIDGFGNKMPVKGKIQKRLLMFKYQPSSGFDFVRSFIKLRQNQRFCK
jgi:hypothetical protein